LELERFARDPVQREFRIRAKKEIQEVIHKMIDQLGLDMTHVTERKGSPYTLVCTKTRAPMSGPANSIGATWLICAGCSPCRRLNTPIWQKSHNAAARLALRCI
jgi:hypothetical protein